MASSTPLRGSTWAHERGHDPMVETSGTYAALTGVEISWEARTLQEFGSRSVTQLAAEYDLIVIDHPHLGDAQRDGALAALDEQVPADALAAIMEGAVGPSAASYVMDGRVWALPIDAAAQVAAYRPDLLPEADVPTTWQQVAELARTGGVLWPLMPVDAVCSFLSLAAARGTPAVQDGRFLATDDAATVLELMRSVSAHLDPRCFDQDPIAALDVMASESSGHSYVPLAFGYSNYSRSGFAPHPLRAADLPGVGSMAIAGSLLGGAGIAVSSSGAHQDEATGYAAWVASPDVQRSQYAAAGGQPASASAWDDDEANALTDGFFRRTRTTLDHSWLRPRDVGFPAWQDAAGVLVNRCVRGNQTPEATAAALERTFDAEVVALR